MTESGYTCPVCKHDIRTVTGCVVSDAAYLWGEEPGFDTDWPCPDCNAEQGQAHHFFCDVTWCRARSDEEGEGGQRLGCDHWCEQADALGIEP